MFSKRNRQFNGSSCDDARFLQESGIGRKISLVITEFFVGIRPGAGIPVLRMMKKSVIGISISEGVRDEFNIGQRLVELSRGRLPVVFLILARNEISRSPSPHACVIMQLAGIRKLDRKGETFVTPLFAFGFVLIRTYKESAVQRNEAIEKYLQPGRHRGLIHTGRTEHHIALQHQRIEFLHGIPWEAITRKTTERATRGITALARLHVVLLKSDLCNFKARLFLPWLDGGPKQHLTIRKFLGGRLETGAARTVNDQNVQRTPFLIVVFHRVQTNLHIPCMSLFRIVLADLVPPFPIFETHKIPGLHSSTSWVRDISRIESATGNPEFPNGFPQL